MPCGIKCGVDTETGLGIGAPRCWTSISLVIPSRGPQQNVGLSGIVLALKLMSASFTSRAVADMTVIHASHLSVGGSSLLDRYALVFPWFQSFHEKFLGNDFGFIHVQMKWFNDVWEGERQADTLFKALKAFYSVSVHFKDCILPPVLAQRGLAISENPIFHSQQYPAAPKLVWEQEFAKWLKYGHGKVSNFLPLGYS